jgi:hypothetical protein
MKKAFLLTGIVAWSILGLLILAFLFIGLSGTDAPEWVKRLPGYGAIRGGDTMFYIGGGNTANLIKEESFSLDGIGALNVSASYHRITVTLNNGNKLTVSHYDYEDANPFEALSSPNESDMGILNISTSRRTAIGIFNFSVGINPGPRLEISVPRSYADRVALITTSGSIRIEDSVAWGDTMLETSSGSIRLNADAAFGSLGVKATSGSIRSSGSITGSMLDFSASSGSIHLNGGRIRCDSLSVRSTSGSVALAACEAVGQVSLKTSSGSVRTGNIKGADITIETSSGSQTLGALDASGAIRLTSSSGSVRADAVRSPQNTVRTSSGSIRIGELAGERDVQSRSGSVRIG